jgi:drug/metabolite transporter (DMT)-like permease
MEVYLGAILSFSAMVSSGIGDYLAKLASVRIGSTKTSFYVRFLGLIPPVLVIIFQVVSKSLDYAAIDLGSFLIFGTIIGVLISTMYLVYYRGLEIGSVSIVTTVTSAWFAVSVILAVIFLGETPTALQVLLISTIVVGIGTLSDFRSVSFPQIFSSDRTSGFGHAVYCMLILGTITVLAKPMIEAGGPFLGSAYTHILSSVFLFATIIWRGISLGFPIKGNLKYVLGAAFFDSTGIMLFFMAILISPITLVTPIMAAHPLITMTCARIFDKEGTSRVQSIGIFLTLGGIVLLGLIG